MYSIALLYVASTFMVNRPTDFVRSEFIRPGLAWPNIFSKSGFHNSDMPSTGFKPKTTKGQNVTWELSLRGQPLFENNRKTRGYAVNN